MSEHLVSLPVVVGIDGSAGAEQALSWALDEARSRGVGVRLVYGYRSAAVYSSMALYGSMPVPDPEDIRRNAHRLLATASARASRLAPDVAVSAKPVGDDAARMLIAESRAAALVVIGSRHRGAAKAVLLGSVGAKVSAGAHCPVVVWRGPESDPAEGRGVVLGVDAYDPNDETLAFGFDFAERRQVPLNVISCWHRDLLAETSWRPESPAPDRVEAQLRAVVAPWADKFPDVRLQLAIERHHPIEALVEASTAQRLLVVGSAGRGARIGSLLGSVSQGVLHHATCPVAVVPTNGG